MRWPGNPQESGQRTAVREMPLARADGRGLSEWETQLIAPEFEGLLPDRPKAK